MRTLLLLTLLALPALAQVPAHSVVNGLTIDIADTTITVPYGSAETRAVISVCNAAPVTSFAFSIDFVGALVYFDVEAGVVIKTDNGYCGSIVAPVEAKKLNSVAVKQSTSAQVSAPVTAGSTAAQQHSRQDQR